MLFRKKNNVNYATDLHLSLLLQYYQKFLKDHLTLKPRTDKLEEEVIKLNKSITALLNFLQADLTEDMNNCRKRTKKKEPKLNSIYSRRQL